jgi:hypothetical protein
MRLRGMLPAVVAALLALTPVFALPVLGSSAAPRTAESTAAAVAAAPKVVIVVGAVQGSTSSYRAKGDEIYNEAIKYTPNVIKIYSPNATWAKVKAAAQGASIFVYLGHGYGFPSPYRAVLSTDVQDGMGINGKGGVNDKDLKYYGEARIANEIRFAKNAVVFLSGLCYAGGSSENGDPPPSIPVARQRVDNFASGWIKAGARAVYVDTWASGVAYAIASIFTTDQSFEEVWTGAYNYHWDELPFIPVRNPQYSGRIDPSSGLHRAFVGAMNMRTTDVIAGAGVASTSAAPDTVGPELWSVDGRRELTPNHDGDADTLSLLARYSETVNWSAQVVNSHGDVVRSLSGTGHQAYIHWDLKVDGNPVPDGDYDWILQATDASGNPTPDVTGPFTIDDEATPDTGVLSFAPTTPTMTKSGSISYALKFAAPVTGLAAGDFTIMGSAPKCKVGTPVGSGTDYVIPVTGCKTGTVAIYINAGVVVDGSLNVGPAGPIRAPTVTIDGSLPKATTPRPGLRTGLALEGASTSQRLLARVSWSGSDSGSGVASYEVGRSYDGGAYTTIATGVTATFLDTTLNPGHAYKFRVRARDKAGNVGAWVSTYTWRPALIQNSNSALKYTGSWAGSSNAAASGGSIRSSSTAGASVSYKFTGRAVAVVVTRSELGGQVKVYVDGAYVTTVDTHADSTAYRQIVFSRGWSSYKTHTVKLVVVGTAGHPKVALDAFEVIR